MALGYRVRTRSYRLIPHLYATLTSRKFQYSVAADDTTMYMSIPYYLDRRFLCAEALLPCKFTIYSGRREKLSSCNTSRCCTENPQSINYNNTSESDLLAFRVRYPKSDPIRNTAKANRNVHVGMIEAIIMAPSFLPQSRTDMQCN